mgnify:CR=1 FL=1
MSAISDYLKQVETNLSQGNATEHTYRPALHSLLKNLFPDLLITNEPRHVTCGAPDFVISKALNIGALIIGYIETKDVGKPLDQVERTPQLKRYLSALENLVLTDYLEFRWYVNGERRRAVRLAEITPDGKFKKIREGEATIEDLFGDFVANKPQEITNPRDLAQRMARLTHLIRDIIIEAFNRGEASPSLNGWRKAFAKVLVANLDQPEKTGEFADMLSQTLAYGLFSARIRDLSIGFTRQEAQTLIPRTNPFLRDFFYQITGPQLDDEPFVSFVEDIVSLLDHTDMHAVLADFGKRTRQEDPVVHFYETFLAAYDPKLREARGVYFTPEPVVSYIVRSVNYLLKTRFNLPDGLADTSKITIPSEDPSKLGNKTNRQIKKTESHRVLILDPACGTGTFLYGVIDLIRQRFMEQGNAGMWPVYVREHLLPRIFGFELLMAPYAIAHFKIALQLAGQDLPESIRKDWAYDFDSDERIRIFLTNTLEAPHEHTGLPLFTQFLATETDSANQVKQHLPVLIIIGNPPYSVNSSNIGEWISNLVRDNYYPRDDIREVNPKMLLDDYVKFFRWAQWRLEKTGSGILGFISNHGYLDNPSFRNMRKSLLEHFDEIFILNLHGNVIKREITPEGSNDVNVFDIQQGVSIGIFIKQYTRCKNSTVYYADLWGERNIKYELLKTVNVAEISWQILDIKPPYFYFKPINTEFLPEYENGWLITEIFPKHSVGLYSARDSFVIDFDTDKYWNKINDFIKLPVEAARNKYSLGKDARDWKVINAQEDILISGPKKELISKISYRPFDDRVAYYTGRSGGIICMPRPDVMFNLLDKNNLALCFIRRSRVGDINNFFVANNIVDKSLISSSDNCYVAPLYIYTSKKDNNQILLKQENIINSHLKQLNLSLAIIDFISNNLGLEFISETRERLDGTFGPETIFNYIYGIFYSTTYRERYAEFLKVDFPRIPFTSNIDLFNHLSDLGGELVSLHLLNSPQLAYIITRYPIPGNNLVDKGHPRYVEKQQRVYINKDQFFEGIRPEVWVFRIGGYQVCDKWLKDRRGRQLTYDDLTHYQKIIVALSETIRLMSEIDRTIDEYSGWPIQ